MTYEKTGLFVEDALLEKHAENFARGLRPDGKTRGRQAAAEVREALRTLRRRREELEARYAASPAVPEAARWLLDNEYLARRAGLAAAEALAHCPPLRASGGAPLALTACEALVRAGLGSVTEARIAAFLTGMQTLLPLERAEMGVISAGLRRALLLRLAETAFGGPDGDAAEAGRVFTSLRLLDETDLERVLLRSDRVEQTLLLDPAGIYPRMSGRSRKDYRERLSALARRSGLGELAAARRVLQLAEAGTEERAHVGWWILREPLGKRRRERRGGLYIAGNVLLTLFLSLLPAFLTGSAAAFFLLLLPVSELVKTGLDALLLRFTPPAFVPRLALEDGVPPEGRCLGAVSVLLGSVEAAEAAVRRLEECRHLCRDAGPELRWALLADLPDAKAGSLPGEDAILKAAAAGVEALNRRCGGGFFLLTRPRKATKEGVWRGWERKRGALLETMRLLRGLPSSVTVAAGDPDALAGTRYLLALDADTRPAPGAARELLGAMLHPLVTPVVDLEAGVVTGGHAILSPRVATRLADASATDFSRVFAPQGGTDPYGGACSELYMDRWDRGLFAGKGLVNIDAYLACMGERVPEDRMLSHDSVEGAFLRCGFVGDVEVTDGCPARALPWYRRLERWTRGDWQNLRWLFRPGRALPELEKWKLFDSLRRSLLAPAEAAALAFGFLALSPGASLAALAAALVLLRELISSVAAALLRRDGGPRPRFHSAVLTGFGGGLVRALLRFLLLPAEAWTCLSAALRALWRMSVSRKKLLEWRTAAQSDGGRESAAACYRALWFAPALGAALALLSPSVAGRTLGLLWLTAPLCARSLSLPADAPDPPDEADRAYLRRCAADTWNYFERHLTAEDHYLPPDNVQVQPPVGAAHRTSPTNVGLGLLSCLAAADLRLAAPEAALELISRTAASVEALAKWKGHLYNWYDTRTLEPLAPRVVSTVDSGNLCACLIACAAGAREYGREDLARRLDALAAGMRFDLLYDAPRGLFHIAFDTAQDRAAPGHYDLMSSEARLTSYLAVARGDVPKKHWRSLSRALLAAGRYRGMASWTGTMFEYLMPELLLPVQRHSLLWETARFCLWAQMRRGAAQGRPWGVSESAYGALDPAMNYRYKAHGCAALALRRGMDDEYVVSPYSTFLALAVSPRAAVRNLRALEALGMYGEYGFWEALDYTTSRLYSASPARVKCVMAHHQGMSLCACANALLGGVMCRRFLSEPAMGAYVGLLREKLPVGVPPLDRGVSRPSAAPPETRPEDGLWSAEGAGCDFLRPRCCLLSGEDYRLLVAETGLTRAKWGALSPYVPPLSPLDGEKGVELFLRRGAERLSLLPDAADRKSAYRWRFTTERAELTVEAGALRAETELTVAAAGVGERRRIRLTNAGTERLDACLELRLRPLLARHEDYLSHPAFWGLGLSAREKNGLLLLRRLPRGGTPELWMAVACSLPCSFGLSPERSTAAGTAPAAEERFLTEPLVTLSCPIAPEPGETAEAVLVLSLAHSAEKAEEDAREALRTREAAALTRKAAAVLGMGPEEIGSALALLPYLAFPTAPQRAHGRDALWRFGISGDLPVVCALFTAEEELPRARTLLDRHLFLSGCGAEFDLVFLCRDAAGYAKPLRNALGGLLWRQGGELLRDRKGGVHILEAGEESSAVPECAALCLDCASPLRLPARQTAWRRAERAASLPGPTGALPTAEWREGGMFSFDTSAALPERQWQQMLTNGSFGALAVDSGCGGMWYGNARENQLTPWLCRPGSLGGTEALELDGASLFAAPGNGCRVSYLPGAAIWETRLRGAAVRVAAFVPPDTDARVLLVRSEAPLSPGAALHWRLELLLAGRRDSARCCVTGLEGDLLKAENPHAMAQARPFLAACSGGVERHTFHRASALAKRYDGRSHAGEPVFALSVPFTGEAVVVCGCGAPESIAGLAVPAAAEAALEKTVLYWRNRLDVLRLRSPELALDRLMNGWLGYQALACRLLGRCSVYQSGGAYGFRDQLQDAANLILLDPAPAREQILRCCARQYLEGDVQHWWHEGDGAARGVRTRCSDDLLWLPWALCEYVEKTGDERLAGERAGWLDSPPLAPGERDRYEAPRSSGGTDTVLTHCARALRKVMSRGVGPHGLLCIGSGDWNDGFDTVEGESVWLSWFFLLCADRFAALTERFGLREPDTAAFRDALAAACDRAWDGDWYLRGWYASGAKLGSAENRECRIDSLAQSFAVLSGRADRKRALHALDKAVELLYDRENGLVKLFAPPFAGEETPGYLVSYGPGFRENGGQYTHGALWLAMALLRAGRTDTGWELLRAMLPANHPLGAWKAEPYVLSADVYAAPGHAGEAGWSWYTGAAGWMLRIVTEELLGLRQKDGRLYISPRLPAGWSGFSLRFRGARIEVSGKRVTVNGKEYLSSGIPARLLK